MFFFHLHRKAARCRKGDSREKKEIAPVLGSKGSGVLHPLSPVIRLGLRNQRKKETKIPGQLEWTNRTLVDHERSDV